SEIAFQRRRPIMDRTAFEFLKPWDLEPSVASASCDDDAACLHPLTRRKQQVAGTVSALELYGLIRDCDLHAEFLGLAKGASHQCHARDASREAEIIFDPRRRAGLTAEGTAVDDEDRQALRSCINRGCKPGWARSDHHHVVKSVRVQFPNQADAARELILAWVS